MFPVHHFVSRYGVSRMNSLSRVCLTANRCGLFVGERRLNNLWIAPPPLEDDVGGGCLERAPMGANTVHYSGREWCAVSGVRTGQVLW